MATRTFVGQIIRVTDTTWKVEKFATATTPAYSEQKFNQGEAFTAMKLMYSNRQIQIEGPTGAPQTWRAYLVS